MKKSNWFAKFLRWWQSLHLTDRILLIFMGILLIQSAHNLCYNEISRQETGAIDVVIRTAAAGIFGYFISAGFYGQQERGETSKKNAIGFSADKADLNKPMARVGFSGEAQKSEDLALEDNRNDVSASPKRVKQQIIIVAIIGISSLLLMIYARNYGDLNSTATATLSQLRDFVSGSVGFLIGHTNRDD